MKPRGSRKISEGRIGGGKGLKSMEEEALILENRRQIYEFIHKNPGLHLRDISRKLAMKMGTLRHNADYLVKKGLISSSMEGNLKVYFASKVLTSRDKKITSILQQKRFRDIILTTIIHPGLTHKDIARRLKLKPSTLSKYIGILEERNAIYHEKMEKERHYFITDKERTMNLLIIYKKSFWDPFVDNVLEIYFES